MDKNLMKFAVFFRSISIAPLITFRILFGALMLISIIRFWYNDWIFELYILPDFYFPYFGFDWVRPLPGKGMYYLFFAMGGTAVCIMLGLFYRVAILSFFLIFTYVELIDKTNYLNHYYFVSLVSFLMIFLPAHRYFSLDVLLRPPIKKTMVPAWTIGILKFQLGIVYFFAGLAKLNYDWTVKALPLKIWLPAKVDLPLIGWLFNYKWSAYVFSWTGAIYDLFIPFLLLIRQTRGLAYIAVIVFHLVTAALFPIGMFPYMMIGFTLIFFPARFHQSVLNFLRNSWIRIFGRTKKRKYSLEERLPTMPILEDTFFLSFKRRLTKFALITYILLQLLLPFRYLLYPHSLYWTEQGYRFSWRVMLMEKAGHIIFYIHDPITGKIEQVNNHKYLTKTQEKQMSTQPDMILQFAHFLAKKYQEKGFIQPKITVKSYVTLNGRRSQRFINPEVDLVKEKRGWQHKDWVMPKK